MREMGIKKSDHLSLTAGMSKALMAALEGTISGKNPLLPRDFETKPPKFEDSF
jgi:hypothetical protein